MLLADQAGGDAADLNVIVTEGQAMLDSATAEGADYRRFTATVRERIAELVEAAGGQKHELLLDALIIDRSGPILMQDRLWCLPLGFELRAEDLPPPDWAPSA